MIMLSKKADLRAYGIRILGASRAMVVPEKGVEPASTEILEHEFM